MWRNFGIFCGKMKFLEVFGWKVGICGGSFVGKLRGMREISLGFWWGNVGGLGVGNVVFVCWGKYVVSNFVYTREILWVEV